MKFSIIIPTYNRAYCLERSVKSAVNLNWGGVEHEILIVDDGSTDDTINVSNSLMSAHPEIRFLSYGENRGANFARNYGVKDANGEWIIFMDSDDFFSEDALDVILDSIHAHPDILLFAFAAKNMKGMKTSHICSDEYRLKGWADWFDKEKFDGEFHKVIARDILLEYPFSETVNGFEGVTWYQIQKKYWQSIIYIDKVTRIIDDETTDSLLRGNMSDRKLDNILEGNLLRLQVMEDDLRTYQKKGKDGLAATYTFVGISYIRKKNKKQGLRYTWKAFCTDPFEARVYRNILALMGIVK